MNNSSLPVIVSVIIPVYNTEPYLNECLDSVINQTLSDIEIICINDGSTDKSLSILKEYEASDARISVINLEHCGVSVARNRGMQCAKGEYIYFLDSDDYIEPDTLGKAVKPADADQLDVILFNFERVADSEEILKKHPCDINQLNEPCGICSGVEYMKIALQNEAYIPMVWKGVWRKSFLLENNIWFHEGILYEDVPFCFQAFMTASKVLHIPDVFHHYRARETSITASHPSHQNLLSYFECSKEILKYALNGPYDPDREYIIKRTFEGINKEVFYTYSVLTIDEQVSIPFSREIDEALLKHIIAPYDLKYLDIQRNEVELIHSSWTYRIGRFATWLPRKIRDISHSFRQK